LHKSWIGIVGYEKRLTIALFVQSQVGLI